MSASQRVNHAAAAASGGCLRLVCVPRRSRRDNRQVISDGGGGGGGDAETSHPGDARPPVVNSAEPLSLGVRRMQNICPLPSNVTYYRLSALHLGPQFQSCSP